MKKYAVTIAMPIYNVAQYVEKSLLSALNQTFPNIEYLIVDDKGQDESMKIVNRLIQTHPRGKDVRIIDQVYNQKLGAARNAGIDNATGEYLFFMDSDDVITPECIEIMYRSMQEHPVDFVAASFVRRDLEGKEYPGVCYSNTLVEEGRFAVAQYRYGKGCNIFVTVWNKLYKLDFLKKYQIRCIPHFLSEDAWFTYQVILNASSCHLMPDCTLYYTYNPQSLTEIAVSKGYSENVARQCVEIQKLKSSYINNMVELPFYRNLLTDIMFMSVYYSYRIEASPMLALSIRRELVQTLLTRSFTYPNRNTKGGYTLKYLIFSLFFSLPMVCKRSLVVSAVNLKIKDKIRRWIHF